MNRNDLYNSFNEIDDDILERSDAATGRRTKPVWLKWGGCRSLPVPDGKYRCSCSSPHRRTRKG
jgi:hypothetical protein